MTTKNEVSETSGRGIGMAALRHVVTGLAGTIEVVSERGVGTQLRFRIPEPGAGASRAQRISIASMQTFTSRIPRINVQPGT